MLIELPMRTFVTLAKMAGLYGRVRQAKAGNIHMLLMLQFLLKAVMLLDFSTVALSLVIIVFSSMLK